MKQIMKALILILLVSVHAVAQAGITGRVEIDKSVPTWEALRLSKQNFRRCVIRVTDLTTLETVAETRINIVNLGFNARWKPIPDHDYQLDYYGCTIYVAINLTPARFRLLPDQLKIIKAEAWFDEWANARTSNNP